MTKLLILSDSHNSASAVERILHAESDANAVVFLGDGLRDLEEALNAAQAIGDDRLQQQSQGRVVPDSFTHGTSQQRYSWFKRGFDSGDPAQCNTFGKSI